LPVSGAAAPPLPIFWRVAAASKVCGGACAGGGRAWWHRWLTGYPPPPPGVTHLAVFSRRLLGFGGAVEGRQGLLGDIYALEGFTY